MRSILSSLVNTHMEVIARHQNLLSYEMAKLFALIQLSIALSEYLVA